MGHTDNLPPRRTLCRLDGLTRALSGPYALRCGPLAGTPGSSTHAASYGGETTSTSFTDHDGTDSIGDFVKNVLEICGKKLDRQERMTDLSGGGRYMLQEPQASATIALDGCAEVMSPSGVQSLSSLLWRIATGATLVVCCFGMVGLAVGPPSPSSKSLPSPQAHRTSRYLREVSQAVKPVEYSKEVVQLEVKDLPGVGSLGPLPFRHFSGYLFITPTKRIFYWFVEAVADPANAPLTMWTNGGPGCSGLIGALNEMGPFRPTEDGRGLSLNPHSWNRVSNMLFVESHVNVGFSHSTAQSPTSTDTNTINDVANTTSTDTHMTDELAAEDHYMTLQTFMETYPQYRENELYLASESYGGHYIPMLADLIAVRNTEGRHAYINLRGFAVGNPYTNPIENFVGMMQTLWGHQLIPEDMYNSWEQQCLDEGLQQVFHNQTCITYAHSIINITEGIDRYGLDSPVCPHGDLANSQHVASRRRILLAAIEAYTSLTPPTQLSADSPASTSTSTSTSPSAPTSATGHEEEGDSEDAVPRSEGEGVEQAAQKVHKGHHANSKYRYDYPVGPSTSGSNSRRLIIASHAARGGDTEGAQASPTKSPDRPTKLQVKACQDFYTTQYLNRPDVKEALHAKADVGWKMCAGPRLNYRREEDVFMDAYYKRIVERHPEIRILVYSGDNDSICSTRGTQLWLSNMGWSKQREWKPWRVNGQVAGYMERYTNGLVFATVHGAGHQVPTYKPEESLQLFTQFVRGTLCTADEA